MPTAACRWSNRAFEIAGGLQRNSEPCLRRPEARIQSDGLSEVEHGLRRLSNGLSVMPR